MFEAIFQRGGLIKKVLEATKELIAEGNFEVSPAGICLQAMDSSHVSLVSLLLRADGFSHFRIDRPFTMGMNLNNLNKMLKCANNDDIIALKVEDGSDTTLFTFESPQQDRFSEFELKQMDITTENLGIPETEYNATVDMPSAEFARIIKDLSSIGDTVEISVTKDGIHFATAGTISSGSVFCKCDRTASEQETVDIAMQESVSLTFALRYLDSFTKATTLAPRVNLKLSRELPIVVEYKIEDAGHIRYYLAPKIEEDELDDGIEQ